MKVIKNLKQVFTDDNVVITKVYNGGNIVRIDARTRNHVADADNFFSRWCSVDYVNRLSMKFNNKKLV